MNLKPLSGKFDAKPGGKFLGIFTVSLNLNAKPFFFVNGFGKCAQPFFRGKALIWEFHFCFREFRCTTFFFRGKVLRISFFSGNFDAQLFLSWKSFGKLNIFPGILMHIFFVFFVGRLWEFRRFTKTRPQSFFSPGFRES